MKNTSGLRNLRIAAAGGLALLMYACPTPVEPTPPPATDTEAPGVPTNLTASAQVQKDGEILLYFNESSDVDKDGATVANTSYQIMASPYIMSDPSKPKDAGDVVEVTPPAPVSPGTTLNVLAGSLAPAVKYTLYVRAVDAAGNCSDWARLEDIISGGKPNVGYKPWGTVNGGAVADGTTVRIVDKYNNTLDTYLTSSGYYVFDVNFRKIGNIATILADGGYAPKASTTIKEGTERIDF
jgi:hypothetical protein